MSRNRVSKYEIERCNIWLKDRYGSNLEGPHWRIVWSGDQKEKRPGVFTDFDGSGNFLRTVKEVREVEKYPWLPDCWVLETQARYEGNEILNHNGYDIVYPFVDKEDKRVDPDLEAIQFMFEKLLFHKKEKVTDAATAARQEQERFDRDVENIERGLEP